MKRILFFIVCISLILTTFAVADVSDKNAQLIQASKDGNLHTVQTLLADGAKVNAKNDGGVTALMMASEKGYTEIVKLLLEKGANINMKDTTCGTTALWIASQNGHTEVVKLLLEKGAEVNVKNTDTGATALWMASQDGHTEVVKLLLEKGADVNAKVITDGVTALMMASGKGYTEIVKLLLEKGANINVKRTTDGVTPLWQASWQGHTEVVKLLLKKGADVNVKQTKNGATALWMASQEGHTEVVRLLLKAKADVNVDSKTNGATPLFIASVQGHIEVVKLLLEAKADVNVKANNGGKDRTALSIAKEMGRTDIVQLLEKAGAKEDTTHDSSSPILNNTASGTCPACHGSCKVSDISCDLGYVFVVSRCSKCKAATVAVRKSDGAIGEQKNIVLVDNNFDAQKIKPNLAEGHILTKADKGELSAAVSPQTENVYLAFKFDGTLDWLGYPMDGKCVLLSTVLPDGKMSLWYLNASGAGTNLPFQMVNVEGQIDQFVQSEITYDDSGKIKQQTSDEGKCFVLKDSLSGKSYVIRFWYGTQTNGIELKGGVSYKIVGYLSPEIKSIDKNSPFSSMYSGEIIVLQVSSL